MNILYCCDDGYAPLAGISITSLFENNKKLDEINVYIAGLDISGENQRKFEQTAESYGRVVSIVNGAEVDAYLKEKNVQSWKGGYMTWWRLFVGRLLPMDLDRVLYLDCDTIVAGSLGELEEYRLQDGKACAMVRQRICDGWNTLIGISEDALYYQAGVMLIDVGRWHEYGIEDKTMELLNAGYGVYPNPDQDFLSVCLVDYIQTLGPRYNVNPEWGFYGIKNAMYTRSCTPENFYTEIQISEAIENPVILHCFGILKPMFRGWFEDEWLEYRGMSEWCDAYSSRELYGGYVRVIHRFLYKLLPDFLFYPVLKWSYEQMLVKRRIRTIAVGANAVSTNEG